MPARVAGDAACPCLVCTWVAQLEVLLSSSPSRDWKVLPWSPTARMSRSPPVSSFAGCTQSIATSCMRKPFEAAHLYPLIRLHDYSGNVHTFHRRRRAAHTGYSRAGVSCSRHSSSPTRAAEAALCLEVRASTQNRVYRPDMPDLAITFCAHSRPIPIRQHCQREVGRLGLAPRFHHIAGLTS